MNFTAYVPSLRGIDYVILGIGEKLIQNSKLNNWGLGTGDWGLGTGDSVKISLVSLVSLVSPKPLYLNSPDANAVCLNQSD